MGFAGLRKNEMFYLGIPALAQNLVLGQGPEDRWGSVYPVIFPLACKPM